MDLDIAVSRKYLSDGIRDIPNRVAELVRELNLASRQYSLEDLDIIQTGVRDIQAILEDSFESNNIPSDYALADDLINKAKQESERFKKHLTLIRSLNLGDFRTTEAINISLKTIAILDEFVRRADAEKKKILFEKDDHIVELEKVSLFDVFKLVPRFTTGTNIILVVTLLGIGLTCYKSIKNKLYQTDELERKLSLSDSLSLMYLDKIKIDSIKIDSLQRNIQSLIRNLKKDSATAPDLPANNKKK